MPTYDYKCWDYKEVWEIFVRSLNSEGICYAHCDSENLERPISASCVINMGASAPGATCCGRTEQREMPPCSTGERCRRK